MSDKFVIHSTEHIGRIEFFDLLPSDSQRPIDYFFVRLVDENLDAAARVYAYLAPDLAGFFEDLASQWQGWQGVRTWRSLEDELTINCASDHLGHIYLEILLRAGSYPRDWRVRALIPTEAGQLDRIASDARHFLGDRRFAS